MNQRSKALAHKASRQLEEITAFLETLHEEDLERPDPNRSGKTLAATAAHMAEGYNHLGRLLEAQVFAPGSHGVGHAHGRGPALQLPDITNRAVEARSAVSQIANLTDEQLAIVPPSGSSRFSDGCRTVRQLIEAVITHQTDHLASLKAAVRGLATPVGSEE
jgi:hypothetical protein